MKTSRPVLLSVFLPQNERQCMGGEKEGGGSLLTGSRQKSAVARIGVPMVSVDFEVDAMAVWYP